MSRTTEKQQKILKAAKKLFLKQGFSATSMDQIVLTANVSKKTLYHHFPDKTRLFQHVLKQHFQDTMAVQVALFDDKKTLSDNLKYFCQQFLDFLLQPQTVTLFRLLIAESNRFPALTQALVVDGHGPYTQHLIAYLTKQTELGYLKISKIDLAAYQLVGMIKEYNFWLKLFGIKKDLSKNEMEDSIAKSVALFLSYYQGK